MPSHMHALAPLGFRLCALATVLFAAGCAQWTARLDHSDQTERQEQFSKVDEHSSFPAIARSTFEQINLIELVDPTNSAKDRYPALWERAARGRTSNSIPGAHYDLVLAWFRESPTDPLTKRRHRDSVQDRILAVSTSRCNVFKTYLRRNQTEVNFTLGTATTVAGVLGALAGGLQASRNLAAAAGIFSGTQAEFNQNYYGNLAAHVIIEGIELRQSRLTRDLLQARATQSIDQYSMEAAIKDALFIDGSCSTVAGLMEAQQSIKEVENPGLQQAARTVVRANALRGLLQNNPNDLQRTGQLDNLLSLATTGVPALSVLSTRSSEAGDSGSWLSGLAHASNTPVRLATFVSNQAAVLRQDFSAAKQAADDGQKIARDPKSVGDAFQTQASKELTQVLKAPASAVPTCLSKLPQLSNTLAAAASSLALASTDLERIAGKQNFDRALADVQAAAQRLELAAAAYEKDISDSAQRWRAAWSAPGALAGFDPASLAGTPIIADNGTRAALFCRDASG